MDGSASNSSSDFVRKLYKMLEDPSYRDIVRWSDSGDSFVVLENEKFTKSILPKHFKHSNFASFVRQLNKYDFHKCRTNDQDSGGPSPYGPGAWEFKHDQFRKDSAASLDSIKRKAPAPRKPNMPNEEFGLQQIDLVNSQLVATQHQLQHLQERYNELAQGHVVLLQQTVQLQKIVKNHDGVMHRVMGFLHSVDAQRRGSRVPGMMSNGSTNGMGIADLVGPSADDHPASPLQQAQELLGEYPAELVNKDLLEQMTVDFSYRNDYSTPPHEQTLSSSLGPTSGGNSSTMGHASLNYDLDNMVYPVGQTNGIDPINSEHVNNIPYSLPPSGMPQTEQQADLQMTKPHLEDRKKSTTDPGWGSHKPRILLVEDDKTCARIGCKFLQNYDCGVDTARDGLEAVSKINNGPGSFDLVLMDIIMPHLDGVSATVCIREVNQVLPVIAMTSNIRADDIEMYFRYGMNDVLPKPFTKDGMFRILDKHLAHLKRSNHQPQPPLSAGFATPAGSGQALMMNMSHMSTAQSLKDESSPGKSPASSWHSPTALNSGSPGGPQQSAYAHLSGTSAYAMTTNQPHAAFPPPSPMGAPRPNMHRRVMSDVELRGQDDRPSKRQQMYPPPQPSFHQ